MLKNYFENERGPMTLVTSDPMGRPLQGSNTHVVSIDFIKGIDIDGKIKEIVRISKNLVMNNEYLVILLGSTTHLKQREGRFSKHLFNRKNGGWIDSKASANRILEEYWKQGFDGYMEILHEIDDSIQYYAKGNVIFALLWEAHVGFKHHVKPLSELIKWINKNFYGRVKANIAIGTSREKELKAIENLIPGDIKLGAIIEGPNLAYRDELPKNCTAWNRPLLILGFHPEPAGYQHTQKASPERRAQKCRIFSGNYIKKALDNYVKYLEFCIDNDIYCYSAFFERYLKKISQDSRIRGDCPDEMLDNYNGTLVKSGIQDMLKHLAVATDNFRDPGQAVHSVDGLKNIAKVYAEMLEDTDGAEETEETDDTPDRVPDMEPGPGEKHDHLIDSLRYFTIAEEAKMRTKLYWFRVPRKGFLMPLIINWKAWAAGKTIWQKAGGIARLAWLAYVMVAVIRQTVEIVL